MQIDGSIEFKPAVETQQQHHYGNQFQGKSRAVDSKPPQLEYQLSPTRPAGAEGRNAPKSQQPSLAVRARVTPPVDAEDVLTSKSYNKNLDHSTAVKRSLPLSEEQGANEKIQRWLPSFKHAQEREKTEGSEHQYDPVGAFQGPRRRMVGASGNAPEATTPVSGGQHNSFNNIRRQTSLPKGA